MLGVLLALSLCSLSLCVLSGECASNEQGQSRKVPILESNRENRFVGSAKRFRCCATPSTYAAKSWESRWLCCSGECRVSLLEKSAAEAAPPTSCLACGWYYEPRPSSLTARFPSRAATMSSGSKACRASYKSLGNQSQFLASPSFPLSEPGFLI